MKFYHKFENEKVFVNILYVCVVTKQSTFMYYSESKAFIFGAVSVITSI